ncbi:hypothetical protein BJ912DRAFT_1047683 [Pholiota molesta]|nr:hypothetical protein BJ912DRAFT_1047683 [Pholiota molesta]
MPANLPCIPEFSDRRNNDGDVEELVRLGVLSVPKFDLVFRVPVAVNLTVVSALMMWLKLTLEIWISGKRCYSLCISREISYSHYHIITYTSLLLLYPVMLSLEFKLEMLDMIFGFPMFGFPARLHVMVSVTRIVKCASLDIGLQDFHVLYE